MRIWHVLVGVLLCLLLLFIWREMTRRQMEPRLAKLEQFCFATKEAMREDRRDFESEDSQRREQALQRFYEGHQLYHNVPSILMCVDDVPELDLACWLKKDWKCLANLAGQIEHSLGE